MNKFKLLFLAVIAPMVVASCDMMFYEEPPTTISSFPYYGYVENDALFVASGQANAAYRFTLTPSWEDLDLYVYSDPQFFDTICSSWSYGTMAETCDGETPPTGDFYIKVDNWGFGGDNFLLERVMLREGTVANPVEIFSGATQVVYDSVANQFNFTPVNNTSGVVSGGSYYKITGLGAPTTMTITNPTTDVNWATYTDGTFATQADVPGTEAAGAGGTVNNVTVDANGTLWLAIEEGTGLVDLATFTLTIN